MAPPQKRKPEPDLPPLIYWTERVTSQYVLRQFCAPSFEGQPHRMTLTDYHAKYYAYELTKRCSADSMERLITEVEGKLQQRTSLNHLFTVRWCLT